MAESLKIRSVEKRFKTGSSDITALTGIDLDVAEGEFVVVVGPSGCGKSTLLRLIAGLDTPTKGQILLDNGPVTKVDPRCAIMFQEPRLFPWKRVSANVAVGARRTKEKPSPEGWLQKVGLEGFERSYPHQLSGGMAQRVALARALVTAPRVLFADEPTGSLDSLAGERVMDLLVDTARAAGTTVVLVTHEARVAAYADRDVVVRDGRCLDVVGAR
jgi:ABC-type nitrate/sulfonate/bicarbonate transport system ATPase subunit